MASMIVPALCTLTVPSTSAEIAVKTDQSSATVPFSFMIGSTRLPAGAYTISHAWNKTVLTQGDERGASDKDQSRAEREAQCGGKLIFQRYGSEYFLHAILSSGGCLHVSLPTSKAERKVQTQSEVIVQGEPVCIATN